MNKFFFLSGILLILFSSCGKDDIRNNCCKEFPLIFDENNVLIALPNFFSPNGDGNNDTFGPLGGGVLSYEMEVLNLDEVIFTGVSTINEGLEAGHWDGKVNGDTQEGILGYRMTVRTVNEDTLNFNGIFCSLTDPEINCINDAARCITASMFDSNFGFDFQRPQLETFCE